jgi:hypothetical protein
MFLLIALWLAVVHTFGGGLHVLPAGLAVVGEAAGARVQHLTAAMPRGGAARSAAVAAIDAVERSAQPAIAGRDAHREHEAARAEPVLSGLALARSEPPRPPGPVPPALTTAPRPSAGAALACAVRARTLAFSHETAARGALRPYDPTGPPRRG